MEPAPVLTALLLSAAPSLAGDCDGSSGWCHLPRWTHPVSEIASMGWAVALDGDFAAVGGTNNTVQMFERSGAYWVPTQVLTHTSETDTSFGETLALEGDTLFVGARGDDTKAENSGAVHVFERVAGVWTLQQTLYSADASEGYFGDALDCDGDWLAVGEYALGRASVFLRLPDGWALVAQANDAWSFGSAVAIRGVEGETAARLFVGDRMDDNGVVGSVGSVSSFDVQPGSAAYLGKLQPADLGAGDFFGEWIELTGHSLLVTARGQASDTGAVYAFDAEEAFATPQTASVVQKITPCATEPNYGGVLFGMSLAADGDRLVVGAAGQDLGAHSEFGAVYVYRRNPFGGNWDLEEHVLAADGSSGDRLGWSVDVSGEMVLAGAIGVDTFEPPTTTGGAYFVSLSPGQYPGGECPCDAVASMGAYGTGKPGTNGIPVLDGNGSPVAGELHVLQLSNALIGATPFLVWGLVPGATGFDDGELYVLDLHVVTLPTVSVLGTVGVGWDVPDDPAFCGVDVYAQALFIDPGAGGPLHTAQSNGLRLTIGY